MRIRGFLLGAGSLLAACEAKSPDTLSGGIAACIEPMRREIAFTASDARDVVEIAALGADCREATVLTTVRTAAGVLLWSHTDVASQTMAFAGIEDTKETPAAALSKTMQGWLEAVSVSTTASAPDWPEGADRPQDASGLYIGTDFTRDEFVKARSEARPMLCHMTYVNRTLCVVLEYRWPVCRALLRHAVVVRPCRASERTKPARCNTHCAATRAFRCRLGGAEGLRPCPRSERPFQAATC